MTPPDGPTAVVAADAQRSPVDLRVPGRYHVVGVGGPGMSAVALVLAGMGHRVSGSDLRALPVLDRLRAAGVEVHVGHSRQLVYQRIAFGYGPMPAFSHKLAPADIERLTEFCLELAENR